MNSLNVFELKTNIATFEASPHVDSDGNAKIRVKLSIHRGKMLTELCDFEHKTKTNTWFVRHFDTMDEMSLWVYLMALKLEIFKNKQFEVFLDDYKKRRTQ